MNTNLYHADCLVKTKNFTGTAVNNICNGEVTSVPYGSLDILLGLIITFLMSTLFLFIFLAIYDVAKN